MNFKGWLGFVSLVALAAVFAAGCAATQPTGTVEFRATDAPSTGVSNIVVTTRNIQIHQVSEGYSAKEGAMNGIESVKHNAADAVIEDKTV